jgi:exopolyphosphatase/guanosine-5'-triphosphate,3'-diphosphate pyrophosphatase
VQRQRELRASDLDAVRGQLGREPTTPFTVVARCAVGHPLVIRNDPVDEAGHPFPTAFWLTCPEAVRRIAALESEGSIGELNERYERDPAFRAALDAAHAAYAQERGRELEAAVAWGGVGGARAGVKCLHAHYAYRLAGGEDPVGAWVAERVEPVHPEERGGRVAAIDQGTNSCRLLVVEPPQAPGEPLRELARDLEITRLGAGVDATGRLDPAALERTVRVLAGYARRARALRAERIRVAATSAARDARDRARLAAAVRRHTGAALEVISGEEEAALTFLGGTSELDPADGPFLVVDIGGGSTELVVGARPGRAARSVSTAMGSVRMTERYLRHDPPRPEELADLRAEVGAIVREAAEALPVASARTVVAVAGTATTVQAIALGLARYDPERIHRSWLERGDVERVLERLAAMTNAERAALPQMTPGRGEVIVAGAAILVEILRGLGVERALVSETDILDGLVLDLLGYPGPP